MPLYVGARDPESIDLVLEAATGFDPAAGSGWSLYVWGPNGDGADWPVTVVEQTSALVRLRHTFAVGEVPILGTYRARLTFTDPAGTRRTFDQDIAATRPHLKATS